VTIVRCVKCSHAEESAELDPACRKCGSAVIIDGPTGAHINKDRLDDLPPGVWRYRPFMPDIANEDVVTLGEGATPLLHAERLGDELGLRHLLLKDESRNPTGSFLDRGSTVLVSLARREGVKECTCVTTGNLGASLAAYCAKADVKAHVRVNPNTDQGKLFQMLAYGAEIEASTNTSPARGTGRSLAVTAANPYLLEGEKTTGFEIVHELGWKAPDVIVVPVGTGGHLSMIWRSIVQLREAGLLDRTSCRLLGVRLGGVASRSRRPHARRALESRGSPLAELEESEPFFLDAAESSMAESGGRTVEAGVGETLAATGLLARTEGIFAEPSSASVVASLQGAVRAGLIQRSETVVGVITGAGLKDTKAVSRLAKQTRRVVLREGFATRSPTVGETKLEIRRLLRRKPGYGYEIWLLLGSRRRISTASVYQHLSELEGLSLVRRRGSVVAAGRERVVYDLTKKGADFLRMMGKLGD
jgi:threonine synthase